MRTVLIFLAALAAGCASEPPLTMLPPAGVDLSGHWRLDAADSDDPQRLVQAANPAADQPAVGGGEPGGGRRGGRGRTGGPGSGAARMSRAAAGLPVAAIGEAMQWPGRDLVIKQIGGTAAFSSDGDNRLYQPANLSTAVTHHGHHRHTRLRCGWSGRSLVVQMQLDDGPVIEARYQASADRAQLIERLLPIGARSEGSAISRVWDRVP